MKRSVIFVDVDTQCDFIESDGALPVPGADQIVPSLESLTQLALLHEIPILATMDTHKPDDPEFSQFPSHCVDGSPGWMKIKATSTDKSECFQKTTFDIFSNPRFAERVKEIDPRRAVVYGVATDYCIKAAVLGLLKMVSRVFLVEDAVRAVNDEDGLKSLEEMKEAGVVLITTSRVADMLEEDAC